MEFLLKKFFSTFVFRGDNLPKRLFTTYFYIMPLLNKVNFKDQAELLSYLGNLIGENVHVNYDENVRQASEMGVHLKGDNPERLLGAYRPNEPAEVRDYRLSIYEPITQGEGKRIVSVLSKIQKSSNYSIKYPEQTNVSEKENLETYCTEDYPFFGDINNWLFNVALQQNLCDANSLVVVMPIQIPDVETSYLQPYTFIYRADQVVDFGFNYYSILLDEKNVVNDLPLNIWLIVTDSQVIKIKQVDEKDASKVSIEVLYEFDFKEVPAYFTKGDYRKDSIPFAYDSYVSGIIPFWNKAIRMDSDMDAQYNQHLFLERVERETECQAGCTKNKEKGVNTIRLKDGQEVICSDCSGKGWVNGRSPYGVTTVRADAFEGDDTGAFPGVQYIDKPIDIVELTEKKIEKLISQGFQSINMDIIDKVGANQSGVAKTIDRDELNSFISKVSDNIFDNILFNAFRFISLWRYSTIKAVEYPTINKPTTFNALNESMIVQEIETMAKAGLNTTQYEMDLISKRYPNDTAKKLFNQNVISLDPLAGKTEEEKTDIKLNGGITQEQYIISSMIRSFLLDAIEENENFLTEARDVKQAKLVELAKKQIVSPINPSLSDGEEE